MPALSLYSAPMIDQSEITSTLLLPEEPGAGCEEQALEVCGPTMRPGIEKLAKQLENYDLIKTIGKGSFGRVHVARRKGSDALLAVKSVNMWKDVKRRMRKITQAELDSLEKVTSSGKRGFVTIVESFGDQFNRYFVFPYLSRGTLWTCAYRTRGRLPQIYVRMLAAEIVDGLEFLHDKLRIVHCDLKEDNILIDEFGHAVIGDFGLALVFKEGEPEVYKADGSTCGTQGYIAPEALDKGVYSYPVDCWALGCILFSVLIGHLPFDADDYEEGKRLTLHAKLEFPKDCRLDYGTKHFLSQLLEKNPDQRLTMAEAKETAYLEEIDWERVAARDYDVTYYLDISRERKVPADEVIGKEVLVDKAKIHAQWSPDAQDRMFQTSFDISAVRSCIPVDQPTYMPDQENRVEKLFHRQPFYFGRKDDEDDEEDEEEDEDVGRLSFSRRSRGSSDFMVEDKAKPAVLSADTTRSSEPIALPSRFKPLERIETSYSDLDNSYSLDNMEFVYPPMPTISLPALEEAPSIKLPLLVRRGRGPLSIPSLLWSNSSSVSPMSSLPVTPTTTSDYARDQTIEETQPHQRKRQLSEDESDVVATEPPNKRVKSAQHDVHPIPATKKPKRSIGASVRHLLRTLSPTRIMRFSWGA